MKLFEKDQILVVSFPGFASVEKRIDSDITVLNFAPGIDAVELFGWCCRDHPQPDEPHCGDSQPKLTEKFNCKKFKRDN